MEDDPIPVILRITIIRRVMWPQRLFLHLGCWHWCCMVHINNINRNKYQTQYQGKGQAGQLAA